MSGGGGNDTVNLANGTNDIDFFGVETITGGTGSDTITVQDSTAATISGGGGADTITGSGGNDTITGGTGADRFVFSGQLPANLGTDTLADFAGVTNFGGSAGQSDMIVLDTSNLGIGAISYAEVTWDGSSAAINAGGATVVILHSQAGTRADAAAALAAGDGTATNAVFFFNDSANSNQLTMVHTDNLAADGNESDLAVFNGITGTSQSTNLDSADFAVQA